ncbi:MAG TPA: biliverdin-producing heme oxygenase, partial [Ramlibacter sp.]
EPAAAAALPPHWQRWLHARSRRPFLRQDLQHLGLRAAKPPAIAPFAGPGAAWGSIYVMEGSALGGQFIARSLAQAGLHPDRGAAYFHGWGDATGPMWREARAVLAAQLSAPPALAEACRAARQTFDTLSASLEECLHERAALA